MKTAGQSFPAVGSGINFPVVFLFNFGKITNRTLLLQATGQDENQGNRHVAHGRISGEDRNTFAAGIADGTDAQMLTRYGVRARLL